MMSIKTAVLPVAGMGTRVMPLTLHQPKAMIGIVDRPMIHYIIDEVAAAGIKHMVIVTGPGQKEFKKYVDYLKNDPEWRKLGIKFDFAVQKNPYGNGDAVYVAKKFIGKEPFLVCFSDDLLTDKRPPLRQLIEKFNQVKSPIIVLEPVPKRLVSRYGVVQAKKTAISDLYAVKDVVEKPPVNEAPSNLTIIGRYILNPEIMTEVAKLYPYQGKEIGLADALKNYAVKGGELYGWRFRGTRFDAGSKIGLLKAQHYFGARHKTLGAEYRAFLKESTAKKRK